MKNVFIFHGTGGHPEENWFPWLQEKLQEKDYSVHIPRFPQADKPSLQLSLDKILQLELSSL